MGHFIWNDAGGLHYALKADLAPSIAEVVRLPGQFLDIEVLFPELSVKPIHSVDGPEGFRTCIERGLLPIRFTDAVFTPSFSARIRSAAARAAGDAIEVGRPRTKPLIWINMRAHSKVWVEQEEGLLEILNSLSVRYGGISAFMDGWTDCAPIVENIRKRVEPNVDLINGLGIPLFESILWAFEMDAYVCTIGSGLVLLTWIAGKPGVAHAEHAHMEQMEWWPDVRPDAPPPLTPTHDEIVDADAGPYGSGLYSNYHLKPEVVLRLLQGILDEKFEPLTRSDTAIAAEAAASSGLSPGASRRPRWWPLGGS